MAEGLLKEPTYLLQYMSLIAFLSEKTGLYAHVQFAVQMLNTN